MAFTFKEHKTKGLSAVGDSGYADIKIKSKIVGSFDRRTHRVRLMVVDSNEKCGFHWITLKYVPSSVDEVKAFLNSNYDHILSKYDLYRMED